ncbi:hypothetical protein ERX35_011125 [Macrococcus equipercicus]|uniref:Uncharacterized protein n=1 Tax=Macrococcus equipercicus TaxID=69967 RepID=A0ABQ6R631_9STAP|nr:hypothetical protein [Macrococcus equipercicus]KAA1035412.1 hypothetical protein ERX35_011125 [Macrococcus equipercicus]
MLQGKKIALALVSTSLLFTSLNIASAQTNPQVAVPTKPQAVDKTLQTSQIQSFDKYVKVVQNKYVLDPNIKTQTSQETVNQIQTQINAVNQKVSSNNLSIDSTSKTFVEPTISTFSLPAHEQRGYWWGTRHIFRSNAAVENFNYGLLRTAGFATLGYLFGPGGSAAAAVSQTYILSLTNDLNHYNNTHSRDKIYMDVNFTFYYSFGVWHD